MTPYITSGGAALSENALEPGYVIWSSDGTITGTWMDVLDFENNILGGTGSSKVSLSWSRANRVGEGRSARPSFPSPARVTAAGYLVLQWNPSGVELFDPGDGHHTFAA
jgi:hypothetical protein